MKLTPKISFLCASAALMAAGSASAAPDKKADKNRSATGQPNIVLILVDDMGYSDLGCFGSEIPTPNLDRLAAEGVRYTQFYTTGRSCPSRASLMTGLYPHQVGIGGMSEDPQKSGGTPSVKAPGAYQGYLNRNCVTLAEALGSAGYHTYMTGKWHLGMHGEEKWPLQRGFERFYGILSGACSYLQPQGGRGLTLDNKQLPPPKAPYYTTDAFTDHALQFMESNLGDGKPFFLYLAYNAPHWPLHAKQTDMDKFKGRYDQAWGTYRDARLKRMSEMGIIDASQGLGKWENRPWKQLTPEQQSQSSRRMEVYAAQVHCMDYNVGRVLEWLEKTGQKENTIVIFLSDNGACAEPGSETGFGKVNEINNPKSWVNPSYGKPWAQVSNTPLRKFKVRAYEGGISTPFIFSWPDRYKEYNGQLRTNTAFLPDIMATLLDASGTSYPASFSGNAILPLEGASMLPTLADPALQLHEYIFGEHFDNCYVRNGDWKAVKDEKSDKWELYNIALDRTERKDLAEKEPQRLTALVERWKQWADTHNVYPNNVDLR